MGRGLREAARVGGEVQRALLCAHVRAHQAICRGKTTQVISEATQTGLINLFTQDWKVASSGKRALASLLNYARTLSLSKLIHEAHEAS